MTSELDQLTATAFELASAAGRTGDIAERAQRLGDRLAQGSFHVSVLGEFKRGKSTLVNALLVDDVLPTGVLPLTAVATEISFGERRAVVVPLDGPSYEIAPDEIAEFVTEERNPENERQVARVELRVPSQLLEPGVVLVDTPGLGSIYRHNDEEARRALFDADGAILVLSADSPLSAQERELLGVLSERRQPTFFVLNKIDHLAQDETEQVRRFVTDAIAKRARPKGAIVVRLRPGRSRRAKAWTGPRGGGRWRVRRLRDCLRRVRHERPRRGEARHG